MENLVISNSLIKQEMSFDNVNEFTDSEKINHILVYLSKIDEVLKNQQLQINSFQNTLDSHDGSFDLHLKILDANGKTMDALSEHLSIIDNHLETHGNHLSLHDSKLGLKN
jgi:hypothetical protein